MQTTLRKMGNSTGLILPAAVLREIGATAGAAMDISVEEGRVVASLSKHPRDGWAEAATAIAVAEDDPDEGDWQGFGNDDDAELTW